MVTRYKFKDFFLIPQAVSQGTVTPTHFVVIKESKALPTDAIQRLAYKLTHLYYNWPGTVRVPAPCQYAHKLGFLVDADYDQFSATSEVASTLRSPANLLRN